MLDKIERIYNSVGQDDYEFFAKILNSIVCETDKYSGNTYRIFTSFSNVIYGNLNYLIRFYPKYRNNIFFNGSFYVESQSQIAKIINEKEKLTDIPYYTIINTAELIEICERTGKKDEIIKIFQPTLDKIKSWFQNRLYQDSYIDDLIDDM